MARKIRRFNQGSQKIIEKTLRAIKKKKKKKKKKQVESFTKKKKPFNSLSSIGIPLIFWFRQTAIVIVSIIN